jgi:hypothetical protein
MRTKSQHQLRLLKQWNITYSDGWALSYIGMHRKTNVKPKSKRCPVSMKTINKLHSWGWIMWNSDSVILTAEGWRRWHLIHPYSKYR